MSNVILSISGTSAQPQRLEGNVTADKDGFVTIEYKEKGMVKTTSRTAACAACCGKCEYAGCGAGNG